MDVRAWVVGVSEAAVKIVLVVPAHNEAGRIGTMLDAYSNYFLQKKDLQMQYIVVLNGCTDNTLAVVQERQLTTIQIIDLPEAGKGLAIKAGFQRALKGDADLIGFVDADMATKPEQFDELIEHIGNYDGIIASRYMKESKIDPPRPAIKEWGRRLVYQPFVWALFVMRFQDYQCGAKLFKRAIIERITPQLTMRQWAFDVELLYLCKRDSFTIKEWPTIWHDQTDSKLKIRSGFVMLGSLMRLRWRYSKLGQWLSSTAKD